MQGAAVPVKERGVSCRHCGKTIRVSVSILKREAKMKSDVEDPERLQSKVFPARCRSCRAEGIYTLDEIADL
jgi:hypothetical protein